MSKVFQILKAQSEMVWFQANKFEVPRLAFINKMDRPGASLEFTLQTIRNKLNVTPLVIQMPVGESERFQAVIDVLKLEMISWSDKLGCIVERTPISEGHRFYKETIVYKEKLLENLSLFDDHIAVPSFPLFKILAKFRKSTSMVKLSPRKKFDHQ